MINAFATIEDLSKGLDTGAFSAVELAAFMHQRIAAHNEALHAFVATDPEQSRARAALADAARREQGKTHSPLLGIPLAIKDIFDHAGEPTYAGSNSLLDRTPTQSANAVEKLEQAGMVAIGRTNMVEFAYGGWGTNPVQGAPRNPWDQKDHRVAGGSSSGSGVAVAAGLSPAALGTDTGGSVRTPTAWCGIVGMKTSLGLVGRGGVVPLCPSFDSVGPMTRSVRDAALLIEAMAGPDPRDPTTLLAPKLDVLSGIEAGVDGFTVGVLPEADLAGVEPAVRGAYEAALADFVRLGVTIKELALPLSIEQYLSSGGDIMSVESYALLGAYVEAPGASVDPTIAGRILRGKTITGPDYYKMLQIRLGAQQAFLARSVGFDALIAPGSHMVAARLADVDETQPPNHFGRLVNYLDLASLGVPTGHDAVGMPTGIQIIVRKFDDARALRIGRALERERGGFVSIPPGYGPA